MDVPTEQFQSGCIQVVSSNNLEFLHFFALSLSLSSKPLQCIQLSSAPLHLHVHVGKLLQFSSCSVSQMFPKAKKHKRLAAFFKFMMGKIISERGNFISDLTVLPQVIYLLYDRIAQVSCLLVVFNVFIQDLI